MLLPLHQRGEDSIAEFEAAARLRHAEAQRLAKLSYHLGAIYLFGYSVEMRVKALYFRAAGFGPRQTITAADRANAANMYSTLGLLAKPGQHDVAGWSLLAVAARQTTPRPFAAGPGQLGTRLVNQATSLYLIWRETLRYRSTQPLTREHREVRIIADWFASNYGAMM